MNIDVIISADFIRDDLIKDKVIVVIDMLRATSVITTAFMNGCKEVIPVLTVEGAFKLKASLCKGDCLLGGERNAIKVEGFDLSNSPMEYKSEIVKDKTIILSTTNGTKALTKCKIASRVFIGSMLNGKAIGDKLLALNKDVVIVNAGTNGEFSMDDFICSGYIMSNMIGKGEKVDLTDISRSAYLSYKENPKVLEYIKEARHYKVMIKLGLERDIEYCLRKSITSIIPEYHDETIMETNSTI